MQFVRTARRRTRLKLLGSITVLTVVFVIAGVAQFSQNRTQDSLLAASTGPSSPPRSTTSQGRAVFGGETLATPPDARVPQVAAPEVSHDDPAQEDNTQRRVLTPKPVDARGVPEDIRAFLNRWQATTIEGNAAAQAGLYASKVERFFTKHNVPNREVLREKARMFDLYPNFTYYRVSDIDVESINAGEAVITFRKDWDARGKKRFAGSERQRLRLRKEGGTDWKIASEEELQVYWVKRG